MSNGTVRALFIPANGGRNGKPVAIQVWIKPGLDAMQAFVGGLIEVVPTADRMSIVINEEGKFVADPVRNEGATALQMAGHGLHPGDYIAGDALVIGPADDEGETTDLPEEYLHRIAQVTGMQVVGL